MQNTTKAEQGQNFLDLVCQLTGSYEAVLEMAILNNRSITQPLQINDTIQGTAVRQPDIALLLSNRKPATAIKQIQYDVSEELEGIGYWIINKTFKVS